MKKTISVLGSTGSIGVQTLEVCEKLGLKIASLSAHSNISLLEEQIRKYKPKIAAVYNDELAQQLKFNVKDTNTKVLQGIDGLCKAATVRSSDMVLSAIVGVSGLLPTIEAINEKKDIALANKETLVAGGEIVMPLAKKKGVKILPVDSEHSAIFQSLLSSHYPKTEIKRLILTASGGPFFGMDRGQLKGMKAEDALKHPNWNMGSKITIDSATLVNKGLEFIEAMHLFNVRADQISILIHRESIIHSLVEFVDNSVIAQLGLPDMKLPIQYALTYPRRYPSPAKQLNLAEMGTLSFADVDYDTFVGLKYVMSAATTGKTMPAAVNAANEEAVALFLDGKIGFTDIDKLIFEVMSRHTVKQNITLNDIIMADEFARRVCANYKQILD